MEGVVPESVMEAVNRTLKNLEDVRTQFPEFLNKCTPTHLAQLDPPERAQCLLLLAKATTVLFALKLRCKGVHPDDHPVKTELERLSLYEEKLDRFINMSKAPLRPSATINAQAATRFIEHSLPDLTPEQRQGMREISRRGEGPKFKNFLIKQLVSSSVKVTAVSRGLCNLRSLRIQKKSSLDLAVLCGKHHTVLYGQYKFSGQGLYF
ncbi:Nuclear nucleic acid-binding protein C1D [Heracleum sosnowskyi]|uniref:Nuclear nucleic acid-binding protein C1D n=1 Tax=Heracleum sosnowskyi TaxID=360622 RepID=A0AAD8MUK7_9APIA|nr:Nuclear nucleic acid-binding protein C1D [Heracleum sosnowskyi]